MEKSLKIPTLVGLLLTVGIVGVLIMVFENVSRQKSSASAPAIPNTIQVTNVRDSSFTVTWMTSAPATGAIALFVGPFRSETVVDERDRAGKLGAYQIHSVTKRQVKPNTTYSFTILSNGKKYDDQGKPFVIRTGPQLTGTTNLEPAYGTVVLSSGTPATGALVYLNLEDGQLLSTLTNQSGSWVIPLNSIRSITLERFATSTERMTETIRIVSADGEATATTDTLNDAPVPEMTIGKTYDFRKQQAGTQGKLATTSLPAVLGDQTPKSYSVSLVTPKDGSALPTAFPLIQGTGIPGKRVSVVVGITNPVSGQVPIGGDGLWRFTPTKPLAPGKQSVTITSSDASGKSIAVTHTFTVLKSGTQVLGEATPSATLEPTPTATPSATPTPEEPIEGEPIPISGTTIPTIILIVLGLGLLASGAIAIAR